MRRQLATREEMTLNNSGAKVAAPRTNVVKWHTDTRRRRADATLRQARPPRKDKKVWTPAAQPTADK